MRVLHLLDHSAPCRTDYSRRTMALLQGLRSQGVQTVQLTAAGQPADSHPPSAGGEAEGWHFYRTPAPRHRFARLGAPGTRLDMAAATAALALRLRQVARLTRPDLIHVHLPSWHAVAALPVARMGKVPLVVEADRRAHAAPQYCPFPRAERWALRAASAIAAGTAQVRAALRADGVAGARIAVIPPAPDPCALRRPERGPPDLVGAPLLAYAGDLQASDGFALLLAALALVRRIHPALRLVVAGGGPRQARFADRLGQSPLRGHVVFSGPLSYRRAADVLPRADIAVFPALAHTPALQPSRHLLNAMAQGCAIVASDVDCHRELLVHGHSAVLFEAGKQRALAQAILTLLDEPWRRAPLGAAARAYIGTRRSWEITAARYRRLYDTVLAESRARR